MTGMDETHSLRGEHLTLAYDRLQVAEDLSIEIPAGKITIIIGANGCGKSTLLRALARLLKPKGGTVYLDGKDIQRTPTREVAARLGILPQAPIAPDGIKVVDLVARGRYPHQKWFRQWSDEDEQAVAEAMLATGILDLADRPVDELSGGQRQCAWIAMSLAQGTDILLLDEPTTYLDLAHEVEVLDLLVELNARYGRTIVVVLHQLDQACRYAQHLIAMCQGAIIAQGSPAEIVTTGLVQHVFGLRCQIMPDPLSGTPMVVPIGRRAPVPTTTEAGDAAMGLTHDPAAEERLTPSTLPTGGMQ
jgi:iron complex transport system ATP-binding protein